LLDDVHQREANVDLAVARRTHRAHHHGIGAALPPHGGLDILRPRRPRHHAVGVDQLDEARPCEVRAHDAADAERIGALAVERHDGDRHGAARAADDLDRQLGARRQHREREEKGNEVTQQNGHQARGEVVAGANGGKSGDERWSIEL
jgi:hypothetical protein